MNNDLLYRRGERVLFQGTNCGGIKPQATYILDTSEGHHLPYLIETVWKDGKKHEHWVEARMLERERA